MSSAPTTLVRILLVVMVFGVLLAVAEPAFAGDPPPVRTAKRAEAETLGNLLLYFVLVTALCVGVGAAVAVMRTIVPGIGVRTDASVARLGTMRLLLTGVLPLVGTGLLGFALEKTGSKAVEQVFVIAIGIPLILACLVGAMGALPHLGRTLLKGGTESGLLKQCLVGGLVMGLLGPTWMIEPLGMFLFFLITGWFVGIGIGAAFPPRTPPPAEPT